MARAILDHLAQAAAVILLIELLVVVIIFLAIAGGMAFGLRWVRGKTSWAFGYADKYMGLASLYTRRGMDYAARPFLLLGRGTAMIEGTALALQREARRLHAPPTPPAPAPLPEAALPPAAPITELPPEPVAAEPVPPPNP